MRNIGPTCFNLAVLLLILCRLLVIHLSDTGQRLQPSRPDELTATMEHPRVLSPEVPRPAITFIT
jgi:hypothetical protein